MANYTVTVSRKGLRQAEVEKIAAAAFGGLSPRVEQVVNPKTRLDRLNAAQSAAEGAKDEVESLKDELQEWYDNLPENFQEGDKGSELQEAIDAMEAIYDALDEADWDVSFPGMY
jgi:hypothetical protein